MVTAESQDVADGPDPALTFGELPTVATYTVEQVSGIAGAWSVLNARASHRARR
jgi:hypothetical protein